MATYNFNSMREDAIRRAREMSSRAIPPIEVPLTNSTNESQDNTNQAVESDNINEDFLQSFFKDKERMLILALLVILSQEDGNNSLIFALMYLLI